MIEEIMGSEGAYDWKIKARGDDESTPSAGAEAEGRSVGTRG